MFRISEKALNRGLGYQNRLYKQGKYGTRNHGHDIKKQGIYSLITGREFNVEKRDHPVRTGIHNPLHAPPRKQTKPKVRWEENLTEANQQKVINFLNAENRVLNTLGPENNPVFEGKNLDQWFKNTPFVREDKMKYSIRAPLAGQKIGSEWYTNKQTGKKIKTAMIHVPETHVLRYFPKDQYNGKHAGIVLGGGNTLPLSKNDIYNDYCRLAGVPCKSHCYSGAITEDSALLPGTRLHVGHYKVGMHVNVTGTTVGYGYLDSMKRWHMGGGPALNRGGFRRGQGANSSQGLARQLPGTKKGGPVGNRESTRKACRIVKINYKEQIIWVEIKQDGLQTLPGHVNSWLTLEDDYEANFMEWKRDTDSVPLVPTDFRNKDEASLFPAEEYWKDYKDWDESHFVY